MAHGAHSPKSHEIVKEQAFLAVIKQLIVCVIILASWWARVKHKNRLGRGRDRESPPQIMGERERVRARPFGPLEKARSFRMTLD